MNRIKFLREEKGVFQKDLAKLLDVTTPVINYYENEKRAISTKTASILADYFDVSVDYLLGKSYYRNSDEFNKLDNLVLNYQKTPEEADLIANTLNYINKHKTENIDEIIDNAVKDLSNNKKDILKKILYHLHYRYHGKLPTQQNNVFSTNEFIKIPVVGKIAAGQPILAEEYIEGYLPVDPNIYGITTPEDYFYLKVAGQSMNLKVKNGDYALVHKQDYAENGDIVVAIVNGDEEATLKKFKKLNEQFVLLEPMSSDPTIEAITVNLKDTNFKIIGKAIGQFGKF